MIHGVVGPNTREQDYNISSLFTRHLLIAHALHSSWHHIAHKSVVHKAQEDDQRQASRGNPGPSDQAEHGRSHRRRAAPQHQLRIFSGGGGNDVRRSSIVARTRGGG